MCSTGKNICRRGIFNAEVLSNIGFCRGHYRIVLAVESFPPTAPGQFVQLQCRDLADQPGVVETPWLKGQLPKITQGELAGVVPFLRRPMSLTGRVDRAAGLRSLRSFTAPAGRVRGGLPVWRQGRFSA